MFDEERESYICHNIAAWISEVDVDLCGFVCSGTLACLFHDIISVKMHHALKVCCHDLKKKHYCIFATLFSNARALALLTASHLFLRFCLVSCCFLLSVFVSSKNIALYESFRNPPLISSP